MSRKIHISVSGVKMSPNTIHRLFIKQIFHSTIYINDCFSVRIIRRSWEKELCAGKEVLGRKPGNLEGCTAQTQVLGKTMPWHSCWCPRYINGYVPRKIPQPWLPKCIKNWSQHQLFLCRQRVERTSYSRGFNMHLITSLRASRQTKRQEKQKKAGLNYLEL